MHITIPSFTIEISDGESAAGVPVRVHEIPGQGAVLDVAPKVAKLLTDFGWTPPAESGD